MLSGRVIDAHVCTPKVNAAVYTEVICGLCYIEVDVCSNCYLLKSSFCLQIYILFQHLSIIKDLDCRALVWWPILLLFKIRVFHNN